MTAGQRPLLVPTSSLPLAPCLLLSLCNSFWVLSPSLSLLRTTGPDKAAQSKGMGASLPRRPHRTQRPARDVSGGCQGKGQGCPVSCHCVGCPYPSPALPWQCGPAFRQTCRTLQGWVMCLVTTGCLWSTVAHQSNSLSFISLLVGCRPWRVRELGKEVSRGPAAGSAGGLGGQAGLGLTSRQYGKLHSSLGWLSCPESNCFLCSGRTFL